ncbi:RICIN domain-containing protein [Actinoallomurus soli]|uniref:RICIN domain-containing protein n=1 Tax=Actinoallomurus soli TaxID=2952535 RepID=UPI0038732FC8
MNGVADEQTYRVSHPSKFERRHLAPLHPSRPAINNGAAQQWTITPDNADDLNYTISIGDPANGGKCLAVSGTHTANSTPIIQARSRLRALQRWRPAGPGPRRWEASSAVEDGEGQLKLRV